MEKTINEIAQILGVDICGYKKNKASFLLETSQGSVMVKPTNLSPEKLSRLANLSEFLQRKNVHYVGRLLFPREKPSFDLKNTAHIAVQCGHGSACAFSDPTTAIGIAQALAAFHGSVANLSDALPALESREEKYLTPAYLEKRLAAAKRNKKRLAQQSRLEDIDFLFIQHYSRLITHAQAAAKVLPEAAAVLAQTLCVGEIKEHSVFIDERGTVVFSNLEGFTRAYAITDLCRLVRRYIKRGGNTQDIAAIAHAYLETAKSSPEEGKLFRAFLAFPYKFFELSESYYNSRRVCANMHTCQRLKNEIQCQNRIYDFLEETGEAPF